jgi:hypothetical protein
MVANANFGIIDASPRTAQTVTGDLLQRGYLKSDSPKGNLYIGFPSEACAYFFPQLFPTGIADDPPQLGGGGGHAITRSTVW